MAMRILSEWLSKSVCASTMYLCENSPSSLSVIPKTISAATYPITLQRLNVRLVIQQVVLWSMDSVIRVP